MDAPELIDEQVLTYALWDVLLEDLLRAMEDRDELGESGISVLPASLNI